MYSNYQMRADSAPYLYSNKSMPIQNSSMVSSSNPMVSNANPMMANQSSTAGNDERLLAGGFLGPFLLGGITGGLIAPAFYGPRPVYNTYYAPAPYPYPPPYYGPYYR